MVATGATTSERASERAPIVDEVLIELAPFIDRPVEIAVTRGYFTDSTR